MTPTSETLSPKFYNVHALSHSLFSASESQADLHLVSVLEKFGSGVGFVTWISCSSMKVLSLISFT